VKTFPALIPACLRDGTVGSVRFARLWDFGLLVRGGLRAKFKIGVTVWQVIDARGLMLAYSDAIGLERRCWSWLCVGGRDMAREAWV
jgi:hypothetical protein